MLAGGLSQIDAPPVLWQSSPVSGSMKCPLGIALFAARAGDKDATNAAITIIFFVAVLLHTHGSPEAKEGFYGLPKLHDRNREHILNYRGKPRRRFSFACKCS